MNLAIAKTTLEDPLWTTALEGVRIVPRPGQAMQLDFPIFSSGEIDGTVYLVKNDRTVPAGRVAIEVIDTNGNVIATGTTEYDGFYVISNIPLGTYTVRVSPRQMTELNLQTTSQPAFKLTADNPFENGIDLTLTTTQQ